MVGVEKAYKERELKTSILLPEGEGGGEGPQGLDVSYLFFECCLKDK